MSNKDLVLAASKIRNVTRCRNTMGERGVLGIRVQPNHPTDDLAGILLSAVDGLLYGCGDAVIGVNPATESVETVGGHPARPGPADRRRCDIPTQACCLAHITTQLAALERGAPVDLLFQSVAGTQAANASFGVTLALLRRGPRAGRWSITAAATCAWVGDHVMYFETGPGERPVGRGASRRRSADARSPGLRRGPRVRPVPGQHASSASSARSTCATSGRSSGPGWKTTSWASCSACRWACDVCYTNHADADQNSADNLLLLLAAAGCNYFMGVPCSDDVMLNYQSTSYHDAASVRQLFGLRPAPEFAAWLGEEGRRNCCGWRSRC